MSDELQFVVRADRVRYLYTRSTITRRQTKVRRTLSKLWI